MHPNSCSPPLVPFFIFYYPRRYGTLNYATNMWRLYRGTIPLIVNRDDPYRGFFLAFDEEVGQAGSREDPGDYRGCPCQTRALFCPLPNC